MSGSSLRRLLRGVAVGVRIYADTVSPRTKKIASAITAALAAVTQPADFRAAGVRCEQDCSDYARAQDPRRHSRVVSRVRGVAVGVPLPRDTPRTGPAPVGDPTEEHDGQDESEPR